MNKDNNKNIDDNSIYICPHPTPFCRMTYTRISYKFPPDKISSSSSGNYCALTQLVLFSKLYQRTATMSHNQFQTVCNLTSFRNFSSTFFQNFFVSLVICFYLHFSTVLFYSSPPPVNYK